MLGLTVSQHCSGPEAAFKQRFSQRVAAVQSQVDGLLLQLVWVGAAGPALSQLPGSVPGLCVEATADTNVLMKKDRQVAGVLQSLRQWKQKSVSEHLGSDFPPGFTPKW